MYLKHISPVLSSFFLTYLEMQRRTAVWSRPTPVRRREKNKKEKKKQGFQHFLGGYFWNFFSSRLKISAKHLLCEIAILV